MSYDWLASLEEHISDVIQQHALDPRQAWDDVLNIASSNLDELLRGA